MGLDLRFLNSPVFSQCCGKKHVCELEAEWVPRSHGPSSRGLVSVELGGPLGVRVPAPVGVGTGLELRCFDPQISLTEGKEILNFKPDLSLLLVKDLLLVKESKRLSSLDLSFYTLK